jgi:hypothetical protein
MWRDEPVPRIDSLIGLDLAQGGADWTALSVIERREPITSDLPEYRVTWLERWRDKRTARIPERVIAVAQQLTVLHREREYQRTGVSRPTHPPLRLVVDQTGVGPFGLDPLRQAGLDPIGIVIHGGDAVSHPASDVYRVPKRDIAGTVNVLLESHRLRIADALPDAAVLRAELENFRVKININTGHDSYGAGSAEGWREGEHDDLVLAVGIALWLGESHPPPGPLDPRIVAAFIAGGYPLGA